MASVGYHPPSIGNCMTGAWHLSKKSALNIIKGSVVNLAITTIVGLPCSLFLPHARDVISSKVLDCFEKVIGDPLIFLGNTITKCLPSVNVTFEKNEGSVVNYTEILTDAVLMEVVFGEIIQKALLTEIPKRILKKVAPSYENMLDNRVISIARVVLVSSVFALSTGGYQAGCLVPQLIAESFYAGKRERGASLVDLSGIRFIHNAAFYSIVGFLKSLK